MADEWDEYLMGFARHAATKSKDSTKVGAAITRTTGEILSTGFNGQPRGVKDTPARLERPTKYLFTSHAEQNAIAFAAKHGVALQASKMYVTHFPCAGCAKSIIQAGIFKVIVGDGKTSMPPEEFEAAATMFHEAGVVVDHQ